MDELSGFGCHVYCFSVALQIVEVDLRTLKGFGFGGGVMNAKVSRSHDRNV